MSAEIPHIVLPASKSISNRYLILNKALGSAFELTNLSEATDTLYLKAALQSEESYLYLGDGGTTYRFLLAWFAATRPAITLNCSDSLKKRPVKPLTEVLTSMGARISFLEKEGFPPLRIDKTIDSFTTLSIDRSISSQFVTALMLIAPLFKGDKYIQLTGEDNSQSFLELTASCLRDFGIQVELNSQEITIKEQTLPVNKTLQVESDWTSASYFYACLVLAPLDSCITLNLKLPSAQGDSVCADIFELLGIATQHCAEGLKLNKQYHPQTSMEVDLKQCIDLAPALIVMDALANTQIRFKGLANLQFKESNRIEALNHNLAQIGLTLTQKDGYWINEGLLKIPEEIKVRTFDDHRIAMSMAMLKFYCRVSFDNPACVEKSFPGFWEQWEKCTFV